MKTIEKYAKRGEKCDVMKALTLLTKAYISQCGISLGCRTVVYCAAEGWQERLAWLDLPLSEMARKEPFVNLMPHISKEYVPEEYDEYDIAPLQDAELLNNCTHMIRAKEFDQTTLEVISWGILKSVDEEKFLSQEIEVTAPDGTVLQGILEKQKCSGTWVLMIKPYSNIGISKSELVRDPRELLIAGYNDYNKLLSMEAQIRTLYPLYKSRLKECDSRWKRHCAFNDVYGELFKDMVLSPYFTIKRLFGLEISR
jgi:hypothetical protein